MNNRPRVYISGPYSSNPEAGTREAIKAFNELADQGFAPLCPHLTLLPALVKHRTHDEWLSIDLPWVEVADAVLRLPGESVGADMECEHARTNGIPVHYGMSSLIVDFNSRKKRESYGSGWFRE